MEFPLVAKKPVRGKVCTGGEMMIAGESCRESFSRHHHEGDAVGQGPLFVFSVPIKIHAMIEYFSFSLVNDHIGVYSQPIEKSREYSSIAWCG